MDSSSVTSSQIPPAQAALQGILIQKIRQECEIHLDCELEVLGSQYADWKSNPNIHPPG